MCFQLIYDAPSPAAHSLPCAAAMRTTSINRYQSYGPTHLEFPLF